MQFIFDINCEWEIDWQKVDLWESFHHAQMVPSGPSSPPTVAPRKRHSDLLCHPKGPATTVKEEPGLLLQPYLKPPQFCTAMSFSSWWSPTQPGRCWAPRHASLCCHTVMHRKQVDVCFWHGYSRPAHYWSKTTTTSVYNTVLPHHYMFHHPHHCMFHPRLYISILPAQPFAAST